jgi:hypothetical protein
MGQRYERLGVRIAIVPWFTAMVHVSRTTWGQRFMVREAREQRALTMAAILTIITLFQPGYQALP